MLRSAGHIPLRLPTHRSVIHTAESNIQFVDFVYNPEVQEEFCSWAQWTSGGACQQTLGMQVLSEYTRRASHCTCKLCQVEGQHYLDTLGECAVENGMKINPGKSKAMIFTSARVKNPLGYSLGDQKIPEAIGCKYLGIISRSDVH
jgi:hypothetical protein